MKPSTLTATLATVLPLREPLLITGAPGVGKTDIVEQAATATGMDILASHPVVMDPTDARGCPWPDAEAGIARFLPFGDLATAMSATDPLVWFLDDLGQAPASVQAAFMQLLLARRIGEHKIPDCVTFVAATNRRTDRAGVSGILEPVKSRFCSIVELTADIDDWTQWALDNAIAPELIAYLRFQPQELENFKPTADMTNSPCPRTWSAASRILGMSRLPEEAMLEMLGGSVGEGPAAAFWAYVSLYRHLPNIDAALMDPENALIPREPSELFAVATALATKASNGTIKPIMRYAERLHEAGHGEFSSLLVRDAQRREPSICDTTAFMRFASGPLADLLHSN